MVGRTRSRALWGLTAPVYQGKGTSEMTAGTTSRTLAFVGALLLLAIGIIHAVEAPDQFDKETYIGVLFVVNAIASFLIAVALAARPGSRAAWGLGALLAAGSLVAFILSRTSGLPSFKEEDWETLGVVSIVLEAAYLFVAAGAMLGAGSSKPGRPGGSPMGAARRPTS